MPNILSEKTVRLGHPCSGFEEAMLTDGLRASNRLGVLDISLGRMEPL
jgi:hypothetical protein